jgi:hypothetical protein
MLANGMLIIAQRGMLLDVRLRSRIQIMQLYSLPLNCCAARVPLLDNQVVHV